MVKHHHHGAIGHVKHGEGTLRSLGSGAESPPRSIPPPRPNESAIAPPAAKRPRLSPADALELLLREEAVVCSASCEASSGADALSLSISAARTPLGAVHALLPAALASPRLAALDLSHHSLDAPQCAAIGAALAGSTLRSLRLSCASLGPEASEALSRALPLASLTRLEMQRCGAGRAGGAALGAALGRGASLQSVDLSLNDIGAAGALAIGEALRSNGSLAELSLARCGLGPEGGRALAAGLRESRALLSLDAAGNDLGARGGQALGAALGANSALRRLSLRRNRVGAAALPALAAALAANRSLRSLDLAHNELGAAAGEALAAAMKANRTLTHLDLEANDIGAGALPLARALAAHPSLASLNMARNCLGPAGGSFAAALRSLASLDLSHNELTAAEAPPLADALVASACGSLQLQGNRLARGADAIAAALAADCALRSLDLSANQLCDASAAALAAALGSNTRLTALRLAANQIGAPPLLEAVAAHPSLTAVDLSSNRLASLPLSCQLSLGRRYQGAEKSFSLDLSDNPLASPPLGPRGGAEAMRAYLLPLALQPTAVSRVRLMTLGFGGVGKSTFCAAATRPLAEMADFGRSLLPLAAWDGAAVGAWLRGLRAEWSAAAAGALRGVRGDALPGLVVRAGEGEWRASASLAALTAGCLDEPQRRRLAQAIGSLLSKGYFSTVGALKVEGVLPLATADGGTRECSLVDFAGQMEYLVSHQLLLSSMHALFLVLQPARAFGAAPDPRRHHESWRYWLRYLRALSPRPRGSLLLAVSQLDALAAPAARRAAQAYAAEFALLQRELGDAVGPAALRLDYSAARAEESMAEARRRLAEAAEALARDWWVPRAYERLAALVRALLAEMKRRRELPLLSRERLRAELRRDEELRAMADDPQLLQRGVEYLEAVGDAMSDARLDVLLLDPVDWFASFLAHFIRDDGNQPAEVARGVVRLDDLIGALRHEYERPHEQLPALMALVRQLELCVCHVAEPHAAAYLFPCLLPRLEAAELRAHWPSAGAPVLRAHRFRARGGFLPPGLFPTLAARLVRLNGRLPPADPRDCVHSSRLWSDAAVVAFREARVLLRVDLDAATLDIVATAPAEEEHFVGAAKGQASVTRWLAHLVRHFLRSYDQIDFDEAWLCPSPQCHGLGVAASPAEYRGTEFALASAEAAGARAEHACAREGCWHQLGTGHAREPLRLRDGETQVCGNCGQQARFELRAGAQFGWGNRADAQHMLRGIGIVAGSLPGNQWASTQ